MIRFNNKEISTIYYKNVSVTQVYYQGIMVWPDVLGIQCCYSNGYWVDEYPWVDSEYWKDN